MQGGREKSGLDVFVPVGHPLTHLLKLACRLKLSVVCWIQSDSVMNRRPSAFRVQKGFHFGIHVWKRCVVVPLCFGVVLVVLVFRLHHTTHAPDKVVISLCKF